MSNHYQVVSVVSLISFAQTDFLNAVQILWHCRGVMAAFVLLTKSILRLTLDYMHCEGIELNLTYYSLFIIIIISSANYKKNHCIWYRYKYEIINLKKQQ